MGVPVGAVQCGFASQLCLSSPTGAPSARPTRNPKQISAAPDNGKRYATAMASGGEEARQFSDSRSISLAGAATKELAFSILRDVPGKSLLSLNI
jgi:hypothetical protein